MKKRILAFCVAFLAIVCLNAYAGGDVIERKFKTDHGEFSVFSAWGFYATSVDDDLQVESGKYATHCRTNNVQLPNGEWLKAAPTGFIRDWILDIRSFDGETFLVCYCGIYRYDPEFPKKPTKVYDPGDMVISSSRPFLNRFYEMHHDNASDFAGFLVYLDGEWKLVPYTTTRYASYVKKADFISGMLRCETYFGYRFAFDPDTLSFVLDLPRIKRKPPRFTTDSSGG